MDINITHSVEESIVANSGGGQANAVILTDTYNIVDTVATTGDSVKCDAAVSGKIKEVFNMGANDMYLYPATGERFKNGNTLMGINAYLTIASGNGIKLICYTTGIWRFI